MQLANNIIKEAAADDRKIILLRPLFGQEADAYEKVAAFLLFFEGFVEIEYTDEGNRFILDHRVEAESVQ